MRYASGYRMGEDEAVLMGTSGRVSLIAPTSYTGPIMASDSLRGVVIAGAYVASITAGAYKFFAALLKAMVTYLERRVVVTPEELTTTLTTTDAPVHIIVQDGFIP